MLKYAAAAVLFLALQTPPQTPPVFKAGVDLLVVEASVVDRAKLPIADLRAEDFRAQVDGKPRRVVFARYFGAEPPKAQESAVTSGVITPGFVANVGGPPGHTLIFAIDQESIEPGGEKALFNALTRLLDALPAQDAVGLVVIGGQIVDVSRDRESVRDALRRMIGTRPPSLLQHEVKFQEAVDITDRKDTNVLSSVVYRECGSPRPPLPDPGFELCKNEIRTQARDMTLTTRFRGQKLLSSLTSLFTQLKDVDGPKQVVLVSSGLPFDVELALSFRDLSERAAEARVIVDSLHLDEAPIDASKYKHVSSAYGGREMTQGLASIATTTGGSYYQPVSLAAGVIDQIAHDFTQFYELGIQRLPGDGDRKLHHIELAVTKPDATVRTRPEIADASGISASSDKLLALLKQPVDVGDLPMEASAYALRGDKPGMIKIILASELGMSSAMRAPIEWGYVVIDAGKATANGRLRLDIAASPAVASANVLLPPGHYYVRIAAIDGDARGGVLEFPLHAQLHSAGDLEMSDLIVAPASGNRLEPRATIKSGIKLVAMTEFYGHDPRAFDGVEVRLEVATADPAQTLAAMPMALQTASDPNTRTAQSIINTELLDPGRYVLRTVVSKGGQEISRVARTVAVR